jgi:hypothetical protein
VSIPGAIEAVWRIEQPKLVARLARLLRDVGLAEVLSRAGGPDGSGLDRSSRSKSS